MEGQYEYTPQTYRVPFFLASLLMHPAFLGNTIAFLLKILYLELVIEEDKARIIDNSTPQMQIHYFFREGDWNYREETELLTGCWNSLLLDSFASGTQVEHQFVTDHNITFHADGTLEAHIDGEKKTGNWVFAGRFLALTEYTETLCYVIQFDGEEEGYSASIKNESSLCIEDKKNWRIFNNWYGKVSAEDAAFFAETKSLLPGTWQAVSAFLENPETGILELETDPSGYRLIFLEDGTMTVSGSTDQQHTWEQHLYAFDPTMGSEIMLNCNGIYYICRLKQDGNLDVLIELEGSLVHLVLEKE